MNADKNDLTTRFLLGELSEEEQREVEVRFLSDNEFFEQVLAAEDALLDEYVSGTLTEEEHARAQALFESSGEQRQNVEFTKRLLSVVKSRVPVDEPESASQDTEQHKGTPGSRPLVHPHVVQRTSVLGWSVVALIFVLLVSWTLYLAYRQRNLNVKEAAAEQKASQANEALNAELARRNQLMEELEAERRKKEQAEALLAHLETRRLQSFTTVTLKPEHFARGDNSNLQTVKASASQLKIQLVLEAVREYEKYSVSVSTFGGRKIQDVSLRASDVRQRKLTITLPANVFGYDDFKIELKGASANGDFEHVADYAFRLTR